MNTNLERYRTDLTKLIELGEEMSIDQSYRALTDRKKLNPSQQELAEKINRSFERNYQRWYSEASSLIKQLMPDRYSEFTLLYHGDNKRKQVNVTNFTIQDWLNGIRSGEDYLKQKHFKDFDVVVMRFQTQLQILSAVQSRFESSLFDIRQLVQADLFDSELDAARELTKHKFLRGAGAVAGVVLEKHLAQVCENHSLKVTKSRPTINDLNQALKDADAIDTTAWRFNQFLADIRNKCDHDKKVEPTETDINDLINGVAKVTKTIF